MTLEACPVCKGTGWKLVQRELEDSARPAAGTFAVACDCRAGDRAAQHMERARIPRRYEHCDFESFVTDLADGLRYTPEAVRSLKQAKLIAQAFARDYPGGSDTGLLFIGGPGVGKTHLAVAALRELVRRGHPGLFCDYGELLKQIQDSYNAESQATEMAILEPVLKTEVLVIDDLGASKPSAWALETVGYILNARYNEQRVTLLTTNYVDGPAAPEEPVRLPSGRTLAIRKDTLSERIGERMRSRLYEMCRAVELVAPDFRREVRRAGQARA
jgi:DNA replication protein DnaC